MSLILQKGPAVALLTSQEPIVNIELYAITASLHFSLSQDTTL